MTTAYDFTARALDGAERPLDAYRGEVLLVVNTASQCGFTPQYEQLEALHRRYVDQGLRVLGFPCNQFGDQEPGDEAEIATFCSTTYDVTFPMHAKVDVNGDDAHPLYAWLRSQQGGVLGSTVRWNFTKYLVGRDGQVVKRYAPTTKPDAIAGDIEKQLAA